MLHWMSEYTIDKIRIKSTWEKVEIAPIEEKLIKARLRWFGHTRRRLIEASGWKMKQIKDNQEVLENKTVGESEKPFKRNLLWMLLLKI